MPNLEKIETNLTITTLICSQSPFGLIHYYLVVNQGAHEISKVCYDNLKKEGA